MGIFGGASGVKQAKPPVYTCLQVQTSAQGLPIPIIWGTNRISGNVIDYFNFQKHDASKGTGKGGKNGNYTYTASVMLALCEGSSSGYDITLGRMWAGTSETDLAGYGGGIFPGNSTQAAWATAAHNPPGHTLAYAYTCYYAHADLDLGSSASVPNINFELFSTFNNYNVPSGTPDANMGDIVPDFICNPRYTLSFDPRLLEGFNEGGLLGSNTSLLVYHYCAGLYYSPILKDAEQVQSILQRWATVGNFWIFWSGTALKCIPLGDTELSAIGPHGQTITYTPNLTPVYDLGPDDFITSTKNSNKNDSPVTVTRKDPADGFNQVQLNCSIRDTNGGIANSPAYQDTPYRWQDGPSIDHVGVQAPNVISSTEICLDSVAANVVALIGQRAQYIRNNYKFKLPYTFVLLEPGDIVTLTEPNIGLDHFAVRITAVEEDDKGDLTFNSEEFPGSVGTANIQEFEPALGQAPYNVLVDPGSVNTPAFVQPDLSLTGGVPQLWIALSAGAYCGGCAVYVSYDNVTYTLVGEQTSPSLQGVLTASLPFVTGLDTTSTLAIDLTESLGVIPASATDADADAYRTLCLIDDELISYGSVIPTGDYTANLTYLRRGLYGTTATAHAAGAPFSRIDSTVVFVDTLASSNIGATLYFKFPTVNLFGNSAQSLADATAYSFTPGGLMKPQDLSVAYSVDSSNTPIQATLTWANANNQTPTSYNIRWSDQPSTDISRAYGNATVSAPNLTYSIPYSDWHPGTDPEPLYVSIQASQNGTTSPWSADVFFLPPTSLSATDTFNSDGSYAGLQVNWTAPAGPEPTSYRIYFQDGSSAWGLVSAPGGTSTSYFIPASQILAVAPNWTSTTPGTPYTFYVTMQAVYTATPSLPSALYTGSTTPPLPALVASITVTPGGSGSDTATVTWPLVTTNPSATYYKVYLWVSGATSATAVKTVSTPLNSVVFTSTDGMTSGVTYEVAVASFNGNGTDMTYDVHGLPTGTPGTSFTSP